MFNIRSGERECVDGCCKPRIVAPLAAGRSSQAQGIPREREQTMNYPATPTCARACPTRTPTTTINHHHHYHNNSECSDRANAPTQQPTTNDQRPTTDTPTNTRTNANTATRQRITKQRNAAHSACGRTYAAQPHTLTHRMHASWRPHLWHTRTHTTPHAHTHSLTKTTN